MLFDAKLFGDRYQALPAVVGVGAEGLSTHERNLPMTQLVKMTQRQLRGPAVVQQNIGDAFNLAVTGDRDHWDGKTVLQRRIDGDEALDRAVHQQSRILL